MHYLPTSVSAGRKSKKGICLLENFLKCNSDCLFTKFYLPHPPKKRYPSPMQTCLSTLLLISLAITLTFDSHFEASSYLMRGKTIFKCTLKLTLPRGAWFWTLVKLQSICNQKFSFFLIRYTNLRYFVVY